MTEDNTFHLGITMAGAVSAGCYTAGVMDYIFETLELWEKAKRGEIKEIPDNLVPKNQVVIDVMGGASAGGMSTIITSLYALQGDINPVTEVPINPKESKNLLYDSWVHMNDLKQNTFDSALDENDLKEGIISLLNSNFVDEIARKAFEGFTVRYDEFDYESHIEKFLPKYISKDLEVLLSHTLLRGIPLSVNFKTSIAKKIRTSPKHNTFEHFFVSHFILNSGKDIDTNKYLWLNPYEPESLKKMILSTVSTGAFPVGLAFREFNQDQFSDEYIKSIIKRIVYGDFGAENPDVKNNVKLENFPKKFEAIGVDGGAINNEPYGEVASILRARHYDENTDYQNFGLVMIDPFPDNDDTKTEYKKPKDLIDVLPNIIGALWNQSRVKRNEILEQYNTDYFRGVIYPRKHNTSTDQNGDIIYRSKDKYPIACGSFGAFGGFLDIKFRQHDFFLGRDNARNFLRYYASMPYDRENGIVHPMHKDWTNEMIERFKITNNKKEVFLPIIPDFNIILKNLESSGVEKYDYSYPDKPKFDAQYLFDLRPKMEKRFENILGILKTRLALGGAVKEKDFQIAQKWMDVQYKKSLWARFKGKALNFGFKLVFKSTKTGLAQIATKKVIESILIDLESKDLLKSSPEKK